jgi:hypothetical protein
VRAFPEGRDWVLIDQNHRLIKQAIATRMVFADTRARVSTTMVEAHATCETGARWDGSTISGVQHPPIVPPQSANGAHANGKAAKLYGHADGAGAHQPKRSEQPRAARPAGQEPAAKGLSKLYR